MKPLLLALSALSFFLASDATARLGGEAGGGAGAVLCLNADQSVKSVSLADLEEGAHFEGRSYDHPLLREPRSDKSKPWYRQVELLVRQISDYDEELGAQLFYWAGNLTKANHGGTRIYDNEFQFRGEQANSAFPAPTDLSVERMPPVPLGCQLIGAAFYDDANNRLHVAGLAWTRMSETHKAALFLHELLYKIQRELVSMPAYLGEKRQQRLNSVQVRELVALLFSRRVRSEGSAPSWDSEFERLVQPFLPRLISGYEPVLRPGKDCRKLSLKLGNIAAGRNSCRVDELTPYGESFVLEPFGRQTVSPDGRSGIMRFEMPRPGDEVVVSKGGMSQVIVRRDHSQRWIAVQCQTEWKEHQPPAELFCDGVKLAFYPDTRSNRWNSATGLRRVIRVSFTAREPDPAAWKFDPNQF